MQTMITERGQISIPMEIRKKLNLKPGMGMEWIVTEKGIYLMPVPSDPIGTFRGLGKGEGSVDDLLKERKKERLQEKDKKRFS